MARGLTPQISSVQGIDMTETESPTNKDSRYNNTLRTPLSTGIDKIAENNEFSNDYENSNVHTNRDYLLGGTENITEESYSKTGSNKTISKKADSSNTGPGSLYTILKTPSNKMNQITPRFKNPRNTVNYSERKHYERNNQLIPQTSRSKIEMLEPRLKLSERAEKSLIEERANNLKTFFRGKKGMSGLFQSIMRKDTVADQNFNIQRFRNSITPTIKISKYNKQNHSTYNEIDSQISTKYGCSHDFLASIPRSNAEHYLKSKNQRNKFDERQFKETGGETGAVYYDSDMTVYQQYLHLLLIKTSDKYIQEKYLQYINKINEGKEKKADFFQRMEKDIIEREEIRKEMDINSENESTLKFTNKKTLKKKSFKSASNTES